MPLRDKSMSYLDAEFKGFVLPTCFRFRFLMYAHIYIETKSANHSKDAHTQTHFSIRRQ